MMGGSRNSSTRAATHWRQHVAVDLAVRRFPGPDETPLLVAHGLYGSSQSFGRFARTISAKRPVVAVDMRNHGRSPWVEGMRYEDMAADLLSIVENQCSGRALVLGHSMGGKAAMTAALLAPTMVENLMIVDVAPVPYQHDPAIHAKALLDVDLRQVARRSDADDLLAESVPDAAMRGFLLKNLAFTDGQPRWSIDLEAIKKSAPSLVGWPSQLDSLSYGEQVVFIRGGRSHYLDERGLSRARRLFPKIEVHEIAEAGHWPHAQTPARFDELATKWAS